MARKIDYSLNWIWLFSLLGVLGYSCKTENQPGLQTLNTQAQDIILLNEGNFNWGNASISIYNSTQKSIQNNVFKTANGISLGDVAQSAQLINGEWWIVVNNSGKIEVLDSSSFKVKKTISGFNSPRYLSLHQNKVYVTDLYSNQVSVVNPFTYSIDDRISLSGWTEHIASNGNDLYVINRDSNALYKLNVNQDNFFKVQSNYTPISLSTSQNGLYYTQSKGDQLLRINLNANDTIFYNDMVKVDRVCWNKKGDMGYALVGKELFKLNDKGYFTSFLKLNQENIYALDCVNEFIIISDAQDFVKKSITYFYDLEGKLHDQQTTGVLTNSAYSK